MSKQRPSIAQVAQRKHRHRLGIISMSHQLLAWCRINYPDMPTGVDSKLYIAQCALDAAYRLETRNNEFITGRKRK